jgi:exosortase family protein XrtG
LINVGTILLSIIAVVVYIIGVIYFRRRRAWLGYYLFATVGLTLILVFGAQLTGLSDHIEYLVTWLTARASTLVGIQAQFLGQNELMVADKAGWVILRTTIECSALIETSVLICLVAFYPAFSWVKKTVILLIGLTITWAANIIRLLIITGMTAGFGRQAVFFGHAIVGRLFFLVVTVALYWYILTIPTIKQIGRDLEKA